MSTEQEAIDAMPSNVDINTATNTFNDPTQIFQLLDKNNDGRVTEEDLKILLGQANINGAAASILSKFLFKQLDANRNGTIDVSDLTNAGNILWDLFQKKQNSGGY